MHRDPFAQSLQDLVDSYRSANSLGISKSDENIDDESKNLLKQLAYAWNPEYGQWNGDLEADLSSTLEPSSKDRTISIPEIDIDFSKSLVSILSSWINLYCQGNNPTCQLSLDLKANDLTYTQLFKMEI